MEIASWTLWGKAVGEEILVSDSHPSPRRLRTACVVAILLWNVAWICGGFKGVHEVAVLVEWSGVESEYSASVPSGIGNKSEDGTCSGDIAPGDSNILLV